MGDDEFEDIRELDGQSKAVGHLETFVPKSGKLFPKWNTFAKSYECLRYECARRRNPHGMR